MVTLVILAFSMCMLCNSAVHGTSPPASIPAVATLELEVVYVAVASCCCCRLDSACSTSLLSACSRLQPPAQRRLSADYTMLGSTQMQSDINAAARPAGWLQPPAQRECRGSRCSSCQFGSDAGRAHVSGQLSRHAGCVLCRESCAASLVHRPFRNLVTTLIPAPDAVQVVADGGAGAVARLHRRPPCGGREQRPPRGGVHRRRRSESLQLVRRPPRNRIQPAASPPEFSTWAQSAH